MKRSRATPSGRFLDAASGRSIRQVTSGNCIHHHLFFFVSSYSHCGRYLYFVSHVAGRPQVFAEDRVASRIIQMTDVKALNEWSVHPYGTNVYFTADGKAMFASMETGRTQVLLDVEGSANAGMNTENTSLVPGTTAISENGRF